MHIEGNTVLVTGGASGIGFALAQRFARAGSTVVVCGRRKEQLEEAKRLCPELHTIPCDLSSETERVALVERVTRAFPALNVLVNNAGIQNRPPRWTEAQDWASYRAEIAINIEAPVHLSMLLTRHLIAQASASILNVTSGLAFVPIAFMPMYCATKAAVHSFTLSLRYQLQGTSVRVVEVIPPAVETDLGGKGLHTTGVPVDAFADHAMEQLEKGELEFGYQFSEKARLATRDEQAGIFTTMNARFPQPR